MTNSKIEPGITEDIPSRLRFGSSVAVPVDLYQKIFEKNC